MKLPSASFIAMGLGKASMVLVDCWAITCLVPSAPTHPGLPTHGSRAAVLLYCLFQLVQTLGSHPAGGCWAEAASLGRGAKHMHVREQVLKQHACCSCHGLPSHGPCELQSHTWLASWDLRAGLLKSDVFVSLSCLDQSITRVPTAWAVVAPIIL
jgi:hypothetical protein